MTGHQHMPSTVGGMERSGGMEREQAPRGERGSRGGGKLVALVFALFVLVDRASRVSQAAGLLEGLDPPPDLDPDWDGTRRPTTKRASPAARPPRVRPKQDDDAIPLN